MLENIGQPSGAGQELFGSLDHRRLLHAPDILGRFRGNDRGDDLEDVCFGNPAQIVELARLNRPGFTGG